MLVIWDEADDAQSSIALHTIGSRFASAKRLLASPLAFPLGDHVTNIVEADIHWKIGCPDHPDCPIPSCTDQIGGDNSPTVFQLCAVRIASSVSQPSVHHCSVDAVHHDWPIPLLRAKRDLICGHVLIKKVYSSHVLGCWTLIAIPRPQ